MMMPGDKLPLIEKFDWLITNSLLAIAAAFVRLCFGVRGTWREAIITFFGGIVFGVLIGFLIRNVAWMQAYNSFFVAVAALAGKELFGVIVKMAPVFLSGIFSAGLSATKSKINPNDKGDDNPTDSV